MYISIHVYINMCVLLCYLKGGAGAEEMRHLRQNAGRTAGQWGRERSMPSASAQASTTTRQHPNTQHLRTCDVL